SSNATKDASHDVLIVRHAMAARALVLEKSSLEFSGADLADELRLWIDRLDEAMTSAQSATRDSKDAERYRFSKARRGDIVDTSWNSLYSDIYATAKLGNVDAAIDKALEEVGYARR